MKILERWRRKRFVKEERKKWKGFEKTRIALREQRRQANKLRRLIFKPEIAIWRCRDYADGWILFRDEAAAKNYQEQTGCLMQSLVVWESFS